MADSSRPGSGGWKIWLIAGLLGALLGAGAMLAANGYFIRSYLLENPEILPEAMERLQQRESAEIVEQHRDALETPFHTAWAGAEDGDVVLVEFFDYACGYCRASNPVVDRLLAEDSRLKVVWRELPVLGPESEQAAIASLAAARQGRFRDFYETLFELGRPAASTIARAREAAGVETPEETDAFAREIEQNYQLARAIGASGTPTFVIGDQVLQGAVGYEVLKEAIVEARK